MVEWHRLKARESAFLVLYRWDLRGEKINTLVKEFLDERNTKSEKTISYMRTLLNTTLEKLSEIDKVIAEHLEDWSFDRLGYIERNLLRLGVAEILFIENRNPKEALVSYVILARKYADEKARRFVNGILSSIYKESLTTFSK